MGTNMPPVYAVDGTYETRETCRWAAPLLRVERYPAGQGSLSGSNSKFSQPAPCVACDRGAAA